jgi:nitrite reductase/ring-hydroxylating ferredoxin subunit
LLLRRGDEVFAIHDRCSHRGGPLHKGALDGDTIECPWPAAAST